MKLIGSERNQGCTQIRVQVIKLEQPADVAGIKVFQRSSMYCSMVGAVATMSSTTFLVLVVVATPEGWHTNLLE